MKQLHETLCALARQVPETAQSKTILSLHQQGVLSHTEYATLLNILKKDGYEPHQAMEADTQTFIQTISCPEKWQQHLQNVICNKTGRYSRLKTILKRIAVA